MIKWLLSLLAGLLVLVLIGLLMLMSIVSVPAGAAWLTEKTLRASLDPRIEVRGSTEVDLWPMLMVHAQSLVIPARADSQPGVGCAVPAVGKHHSVLDAGSATLVLDWQQLFARHIYIPVVQIDDLTVSEDLINSAGTWLADSEHIEPKGSLVSDWPSWARADWRFQIDDLSVSDLVVSGCTVSEGLPSLAGVRRLSLGFDLFRQGDSAATSSGSLAGSASFVVDDLRAHSTSFKAPVSRWLQDNGYLAGQWLQVDSMRGRWTLDSGRADLDTFQVVAEGPNLEFVSGELDLIERALLFRFQMQAHRPEGAIRIPGLEIRLRQPSLGILIHGDWSAPKVELGGQPNRSEGS